MRNRAFVLSLPFATFGDVAAAGLEISVTCRCRRERLIDGVHEAIRDRPLCRARFRCTTVLPHGEKCAALPWISIDHCGNWAAHIARRLT